MPEPEECGKVIRYDGYVTDGFKHYQLPNISVEVKMVIVARRGSMRIHAGCKDENACNAIKAFMKQHRND